MIDKAALEHLENRSLQASEVPGTDIPVRLVPKDVSVQSLEKFLVNRKSYRGSFATHQITDFARYAATFAGGNCFVSPDTMSARIYFDLGSVEQPGHGQHVGNIQLDRTAPFTALINAQGKQLQQKELAEWLEDWSEFLVAFSSGGEPITTGNAVAAVRSITIAAKKEVQNNEQNFKSARTGFEEIEARSEVALPAGFRFSCVPYHGLEARSFELRMSVITGDSPRLVLRHVRFEESEEKMAAEFSTLLSTALKSSGAEAALYLGSFEVGA